MFGIGKLLGNVAGGILDKVGLGGIAPFVKMGLNAMTGNWLGVAQDVFSMVSKFKDGFQNNAAQQPPLGGFDNPASNFGGQQNSPLGNNRLTDLFRGLQDLFKGLKNLTDQNPGNDLGGLSKIFNALKALTEGMNNNQLFNNRLSISQFTNIQA